MTFSEISGQRLEQAEFLEAGVLGIDEDMAARSADIEAIPVSDDLPVMLDAVREEKRRRQYQAMPFDEVLDNAKEGDHQAFAVLVETTTKDAYSLAFRLTGNQTDAQDVVQEAYLRAYKGIGRFRGDAQFSTWLYRIVANCAHNHLGRRKRHRYVEIDEQEHQAALADTAPENNPESEVETILLRDKVNVALTKLPGILREVVVLRDVYDLKHNEIAEELGIKETTAKVRLHRARKQLKELVFLDTKEAGSEE